ncbi:ABC transporter permease [Anaeromyxobacter diazotrophicus]|uniref:ABC transporter permease n=1 Tax=Anaeromyxobacter diazotrophicus TaxID=2590199 RepID=A0A7I9VR45_9BACT|nr:ABC transporter permease [Anaeromyxobacter diazotrophicus]GEJ58896.1 ABC transporter permease [Anaeromyxobacter diazotrophicus]
MTLRLEPRTVPSPWMGILSPVIALVVTVLAGGTLFFALGKDPGSVLSVFLLEPFHGVRALTELGLKATPLILCSVGLALCFRSNIWNIGAEGQFLVGAITGGGLALWVTAARVPLSPWAFFPLVVLAGAAGGAAWAAIVAFLRDRFHANEILVSLMLVYIANLLLNWLVFGPWKDPKGFNFPQTMSFSAATALPRVFPGLRLHWGVAVALLAAFAMWLFVFRTYRGMQLQVGGPAPAAARYAGFSSRAALWTALLISGALAGIAGAFEVAGPMGQLTPYVSNGYGFTAIIVAFVGRLHPLGCVLGSVLLSMILIGGELAQSRVGLPSAVSGVFQGVLLLALLGCDTLTLYRPRWSSSR